MLAGVADGFDRSMTLTAPVVLEPVRSLAGTWVP